MQEPILVPGPQLHESKDQNSNQESNESANQNSNKKRNQTTTQESNPCPGTKLQPRQRPTKEPRQQEIQQPKLQEKQGSQWPHQPWSRQQPLSLLDKTIVLGPLKWGQKSVPKTSALSKVLPSSSNVVGRKRTCSQASYSGMTFLASGCEKKMGNVDLKMGPKIRTPFWGPWKEKTIRRTPKRGPDFAPHFKVHIAHVFRSVTPEKITCCVECLWAGCLSWQPHVLALGRTVLRGLVFGTLFLTPF